MIETIHRGDVDPPRRLVLLDLERHDRAGAAMRPDLAVEIGEVLWLLAADGDDGRSGLDPGPLRRASRDDALDHELALDLVGGEPEPGPGGSRAPPLRDEVG